MTYGIITSVANAVLNALRSGGANLTANAQNYAQIHTGDPGTGGSNISVGDNTRKAINHNAAAGGSMTLSNAPLWTNGGTSETLKGVSVWDAAAAGNCQYTALVPDAPWTAGQQATLTSCTVSLSPLAA